ncbi:hypothetical protein FBU30_001243 [Linnemannia zychae]|nr:hypothetical protein FBU30_001243 [Linnemannia zychae]
MNQPKAISQRDYGSSPPSPSLTLASRENSSFYGSTAIETKRKNSTLLPSPPAFTMDQENSDFYGASDVSSLPLNLYGAKSSHRTSPVVSTIQPEVNIIMSSPPAGARSHMVKSKSRDVPREQVAFMVNPADIPARPTSAGANLSENAKRGLKRLSNEGLTIKQEGSPIPSNNTTRPEMNGNNTSREEDHQRLLRQKIDKLHEKNNQLEIKLKESNEQRQALEHEQRRTRSAFEQLAKEKMELQAKLDARERDYETMSKNYLEHVRHIRATDDDHSTIIDRITHLKSFIEHMIRKVQGPRSANLNRGACIAYLKSEGLLDGFAIPEQSLEPFLLNLFMESVVMKALVTRFFDQPLCCVFEYNNGFEQIYKWMNARNPTQAVRWRQQLCLMLTQDSETKKKQEDEVTMATEALTELISEIYSGVNEAPRIRDICNRAFELAVAMTGIDSIIKPDSTSLIGKPFDEEYMKSSHKSNTGGKVVLVIFPAFKDKEENFNMGPKVWCY